jgi:hypothetical protein
MQNEDGEVMQNEATNDLIFGARRIVQVAP